MPPANPPARPPGKNENPLTRKLGPAPVWVWAAGGAVLLLLYRHYAGTSSTPGSLGATQSTPLTSNGAGDQSGGGAASGGGGSAADSFNADLYGQLFGYLGGITGDLANALTSTTNTVTAENSALEQAIIDSYTPQPVSAAPISPTSPAPAPVPSASPYTASAAPVPVKVAATTATLPLLSGSFTDTSLASIPIPETVTGSYDPIDVTSSISEALAVGPTFGAVVPVNQPTAPTYGITGGPPAGSRASGNTKQGVYTVH